MLESAQETAKQQRSFSLIVAPDDVPTPGETLDFTLWRATYVYAGKVEGNTIMTRNVAILIFDEVEVLDFCGPFEVFGVAGLHSAGERPFYVYTIAEKAGPVSARNG